MLKGYPGITPDYALHKMSYANLIMYNSVLPSSDDQNEKEGEKAINADDPKNREAVRKELYG